MNFNECEVFYCNNGSEIYDKEIDILYIDHSNKKYMIHKNASILIVDDSEMKEDDIYEYKLITKSLFDLMVARFRKTSYEEWNDYGM